MNDRCTAKRGLLKGRCRLDNLHPGEHDDGRQRWPRTGIDQEIYEETIEIIARQRQQRDERRRIVSDYERREDRG